ncbi:hypothetical protein [Tenacibaculum finnmarkense]|uniref:hypothetical protein n=2 Tax=Tenacibaculum finnmarkense TaxID=2781243 RepID=UPI001EFB4DAA|nr:hypothetical protein [Tenacibaculum finnmarkense]MCG8788917.1 hypothetical protein [Tenacibaculum finnmarkense]
MSFEKKMKEKFKISLSENGIHSFNKGLQDFIVYENSNDDFKLKESVMFLHHGIELLLKQVLINKGGEYLIFSDIDSSTTKKIIESKEKNISVFNLNKPPKTTTFLETVDRLKGFVDTPKIEESLETRLKELNSLRNNLEHYGIETDKIKVENLLVRLKKPILNFLEKAEISLEIENNETWKTLEKKVFIAASQLRFGGAIKIVELSDKNLKIQYVDNFEEYKKLNPNSGVTEELMNSYWETGNAILKAINDAGVRLMRKYEEIDNVEIIIPHKESVYEIKVNRIEVEEFLGYNFKEINNDWNNTFSHKYVYDKIGANIFFEKFGSKNAIQQNI